MALLAGAGIAYWATRPRTVPEKLARWVDVRSCIEVDQDRHTPAERPDLFPPAMNAEAEELIVISCEHVGPLTVYVRFRDEAALERALARTPGTERPALCVVGHEAFDGDTLDDGMLEEFCDRLDGTLVAPGGTLRDR